jgi:hypothetical protein
VNGFKCSLAIFEPRTQGHINLSKLLEIRQAESSGRRCIQLIYPAPHLVRHDFLICSQFDLIRLHLMCAGAAGVGTLFFCFFVFVFVRSGELASGTRICA